MDRGGEGAHRTLLRERWEVASPSPHRSSASMTDGRSYGSPGAFRRALTDKLRDLATGSRWTLQQLQRQMAYDRLLERLYLIDDGWIIKGATALLARDIGVRATIDIDVYREAAREVAEADLRRAASLDLGVWFRFEIGGPSPVADGA